MRPIQSARLRKLIRILVPFLIAPGLVALGITVFHEKRYAFISLCIVVSAVILFAAGFDRKKTGTRRLVIVSVLTALAIVGRFIPIFKPVTALTVLTGMYLGTESGFLAGSLTAVLSNFYFGQGPWTPFQMLSWGMIGFFAGLMSELLKRNRPFLFLYGIFAGVLYSFVMDVWTVVWYNGDFVWSLYLAALVSAIPYTVSYVVSNIAFLWVFAKPFGEKLERMHLKYGV
ncbi:MAG: ECF transporter S component [Clostridia bacterium]|nr:ECF transporter S component [Clostridia bacterium]